MKNKSSQHDKELAEEIQYQLMNNRLAEIQHMIEDGKGLAIQKSTYYGKLTLRAIWLAIKAQFILDDLYNIVSTHAEEKDETYVEFMKIMDETIKKHLSESEH